MPSKHPPHLLVTKALLLEQLDLLLESCRVQSTGLGPVQVDAFANLLLKVLFMGHTSRTAIDHNFRDESQPELWEFWPALVDVFKVPTEAEPAAESAEARFRENDVMDSRQQREYKAWVYSSLRNSRLKAEIARAAEDAEMVTRHYYPFSFLSVGGDLEHLLGLVEGFEELPLRRPEKMRWDETWSIVVAKNNAKALVVPPEGAEDGAAVCSIESGYFAVLECEPSSLLEAPLARGSAEIAPIDSTPVSRPNSGPDKRTKQYRMIWTPNDHFKSGCLADSPIDNDPSRRPESPLPTGWDMAYDPITGHDYFIDHVTGTTTWERPLSPDLDPPGQCSAPGWCRCGLSSRPISMVPNRGHKCSLSVPISLGNTKVYGKHADADMDSGQLMVLSTDDNGGHRVDLLMLPSGGFSSLVEALDGIVGCNFQCDISDDRRAVEVQLAEAIQKEKPIVTKLRTASVFGLDEESEFVTLDTYKSFLDETGRFTDWDAFRKLVFFRGLDSDARAAVWPFLLGVYPPSSTREDVVRLTRDVVTGYSSSKNSWLLLPVRESEKVRLKIKDIYKDTARTDRDLKYFAGDTNPNLLVLTDILVTICLENEDVPYVQGMSDILAPMLMILDGEAIAYACFKSNLVRLLPYFDGGPGMSAQLENVRLLTEHFFPFFYSKLCDQDMVNMFFCYRWMLLDFKREFELNNVMRVWETIWCRHRTDKFHLFVALAIMKVHNPCEPEDSEVPMSPGREPNMLEYYANLAGQMDIGKILHTARSILYEIWLQELPANLEEIGIVNDRPMLPGATLSSGGSAEVPTTPLPGLCAGLASAENRQLPTPAPLMHDEAPRAADVVDSATGQPERPAPASVANPTIDDGGDVAADEPCTPTAFATTAADKVAAALGAVPAARFGHASPSPSLEPAASAGAESFMDESHVAAAAPVEKSGAPSAVDETVFTPELVAATPPSLIDGCRTAIQLDAASKTDEALQCYLSVIDVVLAHVRVLPKGDPSAKLMKKFVKFMLVRADHLKYLQ